jgi:phage gpG-like protein
VSDNEVEIGTNDPKAPTQHFGAKQGQYGKSSRHHQIWQALPHVVNCLAHPLVKMVLQEYLPKEVAHCITTRVSDNEVEIGTNDPKAPTQHFGAKQGQYGKVMVYIIKYGKLCLML